MVCVLGFGHDQVVHITHFSGDNKVAEAAGLVDLKLRCCILVRQNVQLFRHTLIMYALCRVAVGEHACAERNQQSMQLHAAH